MEIVLWVIGLIVTIALALIPYLRRKYGDRPRLEIEIDYVGGSSSPQGHSPNNDTSKGYVEAQTAIRIFELTWKVILKIRNNSDVAAYYAKMHYTKDSVQFSRLGKFPTKPILNSDDISIEARFQNMEECKGSERTKIDGFPKEFEKLRIVLEYQNSHGVTFYSTYDHGQKDKKNKHSSKRKN